MKVLRSTLVAAAALFAAACGDKVEIIQPVDQTTPKVNSVTVSPANVTLNIGQSVTFTAVVDVSNGAATTVSWTSSSASVTVSAAGAATAVSATPGAAICATSTADAGKKGCATAVVSAAPTTIAATVSLQAITANGNLNAPVNPAAVAGVIDVRANVSPGTETVQKVVVLVGTTRADSQTFSAAQSAELRFAAEEAMANQSAFPPVLFSINTAKFNATTGVPTWTNSNYNISIQLYVAGNTAARSTATYQTPLTFTNANTYVLTSSTSVATPATSAGGFSYRAGNISASVLPVIYTPGITMSTGTLTFGVAGCDATGPRSRALTAPAAGSSAWTATYTTGVANNETPAAAGNFVGYEFRTATGACAAVIGTGEGFTLTAQDNNGNNFVTAAAPANNAANLYRIDNVAPTQPVLNTSAAGAGPNGRTLRWINDAVVFNALATSNGTEALNASTSVTSNSLICNNPATALFAQGNCLVGDAQSTDLGVGGVSYGLAVAASSSPNTAGAAALLTSAASLARSATNTTNCGIGVATDALGNRSKTYTDANATSVFNGTISGQNNTCANMIAGGGGFVAQRNAMRFGVDRDAPFVAFQDSPTTGGGFTALNANQRVATGTLVGEFVVTYQDTGSVGNSGMAPVAAGTTSGPVLFNMTRVRADGTTRRDAANTSLSGSTIPVNTGVNVAAPQAWSTLNAVTTTTTTAAYWTASVVAQDAAGNASAAITRSVVGDNTVATVGAPSVPANISGSFATTAFVGDNLDLRDYAMGASYNVTTPAYICTSTAACPATPATLSLQNAPTAINTFPGVPATLVNTNYAIGTTVNAPLVLQATSGAHVPAAYAPTANNTLNGVNVSVRDQATAYQTIGTAILFAQLSTPTSGISTTGFATFTPATNAATLCSLQAAVGGGGCVVAAAPGTASSGTWTAVAAGATGSFNNPFSRVDFYAIASASPTCAAGPAGAATTGLQLIASVPASAAVLVDNGVGANGRTWTYTTTQTAASLFAAWGGVSGGAPGANVCGNIYAFGVNSTGTIALVSQPLAQIVAP